jgi:outer membrane lipase/esterase
MPLPAMRSSSPHDFMPNRRGFLLSAGAASVLAACGSGTIESALKPSRIISFGDSFSDLGQTGNRYTVNDNTVNIWSSQLAASYGLTVTSAASGGLSYAQGNARVTATPDAAGKTTTQTVTQQISSFFASGGSFAASDLVLINGGISDVVVEMAAVTAGTSNSTQMVANAGQAGVNLAGQIQRLVAAGAKFVVVAGLYNMAKSPWAIALGQTALIGAASAKFNEQLLVNIVNLGANVLYVDAAYYFNLVTATPTGYGLLDATTVVCNSVDSTNGIGIGAGSVNSALCTTSTITTGLDYTKYTFADPVNFSPAAQVLFGSYAYTRLRARW